MATVPARAQTSDAATSEVERLDKEGRDIIVTGSRIARTVSEELLPTYSGVDQEFIDSHGYFNAGEALLRQPLFSASQSNSDTKFNQSAADVGFTFIDLFGLGSERTLTLVNGKRVVGSSAPQPNRSSGTAGLQVDINSIPTALIDRIDVVTIGGAPIYGADAIAGTVNVVLKDKYEGIEADLQTGISDEGDAANYRLRGVAGMSFAGGRGNVVIAGEYSRREGLLQTSRPGANDLQVTNPLLATDPVKFFSAVPPLPINTFQLNTGYPGASLYGSPSSPAIAASFGTGVVIGNQPFGFAQNAAGQTLMFNSAGELIPVPIGSGNGTFLFTQNQPEFSGLYRQQNYVPLLNQSERYILSSLGHFDLTDNVRAVYRVNYSKLKAQQPIGSPVTLATPVLKGITVSIDNPFLSPNARATLQSATTNVGAPLPFLFAGPSFTLGKSLAEFGTRGVRANSETWSAVGGLEGHFGSGPREFNWDLTYSYGKTSSENRSDSVNAARFALATDPVVVDSTGQIVADSSLFAPPSAFTFNPGQGGYTAANGQRIVCRARATGAAGGTSCLPFNPFGMQNPQGVIDSLAVESVLFTRIQQQFVQANLSGSPFDLPAGPLRIATGAEYRHEKARFFTDTVTAAGGLLGTGGVGVSPVAGSFNSKEVYGEVIAPLVNGDMLGMSFFKGLQFEGAVRYIDNSRAGSDWVWTAGGRLELGDLFVIRGNKTRSVRSPGIGQLFSGLAPTLQGVADPCANSGITRGPDPATRQANCAAAVVAAGLAPNAAAATAFLQSFTGAVAGVSGTIGGNPNLENERADSWTVGLVARPRFIPGLSVSVDWNDIKLKNAISSLDPAAVVAACYDSPSYPAGATCNQFTRAASFNLASFQAGFTNIGFIDFAGLTASVRWGTELGSNAGRIDLSGTLLYLDHFRTSTDNVVVRELRNTIGYEKYRAQGSIGYSIGGFTAIWQTDFLPGAFLSPEERDGTANVFEFDKTKNSFIHNLSLLYKVNDDFNVRFVVDNITEENPPPQFVQFANVRARVGRTFVFGVTAKFR